MRTELLRQWMVTSVFRKFVHDMALRHRWIKEARQEFESTLDYVFHEFGVQSLQKVYSEVLRPIYLMISSITTHS